MGEAADGVAPTASKIVDFDALPEGIVLNFGARSHNHFSCLLVFLQRPAN